MRILELSSCFPPSKGGVESFVYKVANGLANKGHTVTVVTSTRGLVPKFSRVSSGKLEVIRFPEKRHFFETPLVPRITASALTADYDVLHVNGMVPLISDVSILLARLRGKPVILTYHNDAETHIWGSLGRFINSAYAFFARFFVSFATVIVCTTNSYAMTSPVVRFFPKKLVIIPMGVDIDRFASLPKWNGVDKKREKNSLLFVGQLKQYKGVSVLLKAFSHLIEEGHKIELMIVGTGPEYPNLKKQVKDLSLDHSVTFRGEVHDAELPEVYSQSDLVVLPSLNRREAFGLVLLEALASGRPILTSDIPGISEVSTRAGGYLARSNDSRALAFSIRAALSKENGHETFRRAAEGYDWRKTVDSYNTLLLSLWTDDSVAAS